MVSRETSRPWAGSDRVKLRRMAVDARERRALGLDKLSVNDIACELGRTPEAVRSMLHQMGEMLVRDRQSAKRSGLVYTETEIKRLRAMAALGVTDQRIGVALGRPKNGVKLMRKKLRIRKVRPVKGGWIDTPEEQLRMALGE